MYGPVQILDGKTLSVTIQRELADEVDSMLANGQKPPHLAAVIVGANPASKVYVGHKIKACDIRTLEGTIAINTSEVTCLVRIFTAAPFSVL